MKTASLIGAIALGLLVAPFAAEAQEPGKVPRMGVIASQSPEGSAYIYGLREGLREFGYLEGQNIAIEWRCGSRLTSSLRRITRRSRQRRGRLERFPLSW